MIIKPEFSGYWNDDPVADTEERILKVGDMVVVGSSIGLRKTLTKLMR